MSTRLLHCNIEDVPFAVQSIAFESRDHDKELWVVWSDCRGHVHTARISWVLQRPVMWEDRRRIQGSPLCQAYVWAVLERDVSRWWRRKAAA